MLIDILRNAKNKGSGYEQIAAVDLGSNSFRLQIARVIDDQIYSLDSLKESVRLTSGLTTDKQLDQSSRQRALVALRCFGERLRGFPPEAVRVVATNTMRVAHLVFCLRLATVLHGSRDNQGLPNLKVKIGVEGYQLELPDYWLATHPLSAAALADESDFWQRIGRELRIKCQHAPTAVAA